MNGTIPKAEAMAASQQQLTLWHLAFCAAGICGCYLYYGLLFEKMFQPGEHKLGSVFVLVTQSVTNSMVAFGWKQLTTSPLTTAATDPLPHNFLLGATACYVAAMVGSNEAVRFVSYPVAVLAKSCKLIPTMVVGQFVQGKLYSFVEWMAALCISAGIVMFHLTRMEVKTDDEASSPSATYGMLLLTFSLTMDGVLASFQTMLKTPRANRRIPNAIETMLWMNLYAVVYLIPLAIVMGQWDMTTLSTMWHKIAVLNATVALGQIFIFLTITWYSPIITTTITTTRKFCTILLSVWTFGHHFTMLQWAAIGLVFSGLYLAIARVRTPQKNTSKKD